ncbi:MAG: hypothetical protein UR39_C0010G0013 [Candidatus Woesebacteria bacterium GW2011_GWA1_33_30]|uniref:Uncharacterized protein n=1 Tax=Candidatus Woesebacteria bacterium GW2011_GWA2_33_28 TaxID=1618561 RepID=A0A0G0CT66_9BACT|nr:MAG: hypothetical protein UR38_C0010G0013 [Candidatus Woesebacteria bacterium GW2011_GWA2_33_28]KKP47271.1 MAG: hypothetical protein UR39_C0010G0013 [Candidatus Woesebacteria bacterium GW2011_GWA1_33_30]KKP48917.1 MAG: hypothetical protein UR40_C0011G0013 [Microgenomates group bacterium GW2011_GWC1_33_32]KKP51455.1 MAG: hypothetical protein UR44_C0010G0013 [Candidatus Woesebacteria bacterium GW2011_GWB1_33_38]KKP56927.1 MAG: hypothetical protein UR48_C0026G0010 [Microgenomates group bacteriu
MPSSLNTAIISSISDLFINLSAGRLGAIIIISPFLNKDNKLSISLLIADTVFAIMSLVIAINLRNV